MIPDLGPHAVPVLTAYGVGLSLIGILIAWSIWQARRVRRRLDAAEGRRAGQK
ncbi:MAG: heme exporter protein CcmD [Pseudomonadota bacterium]